MVSYTLLLAMIEYKTLILRGNHTAAAEILPQIPQARARPLLRARPRPPPALTDWQCARIVLTACSC